MSKLAPLGILGGTFDPVHFGHLRLAEEAREQLGLEAVRWIPAGQPAHRGAPVSAAHHRLAMTRAAIASNPFFQLDAGEVNSAMPSYSVPTLSRLRADLGANRPLVLLLGADAFLGLESWHRWRELFDLAHIGVATRPGTVLAPAALPPALAAELATRQISAASSLRERPAGGVMSFSMAALDISATQVRAHFAAKRSARYLLPDPVLDYIFSNHLYSFS
jgi:nicotinate-nucleotide adenylyltransferase